MVKKILVVDDSKPDRDLVRVCLQEMQPEIEITEIEDAVDLDVMLNAGQFDCVLLDYRLPGVDGITVLEEMRGAGRENLPPVVMLTGTTDARTAVRAMQAGASDYVIKDGLDPAMLWRSVLSAVERAELRHSNEAFRRQVKFLALYDSLTLVGNRTLYRSKLEQLFARLRREQLCFTVLVIDIVGFRAINDTFGGAAGDALLVETGRRLSSAQNSPDAVFRIGSDEFAVVVEGDARDPGAVIAAIKQTLRLPLSLRGGRLDIEADIATVHVPDDARDIDQLIACCNQRLTALKLERRDDEATASTIIPGTL